MTTRLTREQAAIIGIYTGITCGPFEDIEGKSEQLLGHPIWTHQFADPVLCRELKERVQPEFIALCATKDAP